MVTNKTCDSGTDFLLVVEDAGPDAVSIDSVFMYYGDSKYTIEAVCISNEHSSAWMTSYSPDSCDTGYSAWDIIAVDSNEMWTTKAAYFFDLEDSNISYNALAEDASDWCIVSDSCSCPTMDPTQEPTAPTMDPTLNPTLEPTAQSMLILT